MSRPAPTPPPTLYPIFGVEIEVFVKIKPQVKANILNFRSSANAAELPDFLWEWDFNLSNEQPPNKTCDLARRQAQQRKNVKMNLSALISEALGPDSGWKCVGDASLKEWQLDQPPEPRSWWGVEIISPPMSVSRRWQSEIRAVFDAIGLHFDLWTHPVTSCHVHVSPGRDSKTSYNQDQLVRIAKGAFFWEKAFQKILPHDRRKNDYAKCNYQAFAKDEYKAVKEKTWKPVFDAIDDEMKRMDKYGLQQKKCFSIKIAGGHLSDPNDKYRKERYLSTNFLPLSRIGTVELRRQGGVASAESAIHRVLVAVTLHVSARTFNFKEVANRKDHPDVKELIKELSRCIQRVPTTCHGSRFIKYLKDCAEDYSGKDPIPELVVNARERALHVSPPGA